MSPEKLNSDEANPEWSNAEEPNSEEPNPEKLGALGRPLMKCGHVALARNSKTGKWFCPICVGWPEAEEVAEEVPSLEGRVAICSDCGKKRPSNWDLPFFRYQGPGSEAATRCKTCGYYHPNEACRDYKPCGPLDHDRFYCGCRGWD